MKQYSLRQLQLGYLQLTLGKQKDNEETCLYCWEKGCGCKNNKVQLDPFINFTGEELNYA